MEPSLDMITDESLRTAAAIDFVCQHFSLGELVGIGDRLKGSYNINLKITTTKGDFVVRFISSSVSEAHLQYVSKLLAKLENEGIPVPRPFQDERGMSFVELDGKRVQVTPFVQGRSFLCREQQVHSSASMLRRFHHILGDEPPGPLPEWSFYHKSSDLRERLSRFRELPTIPSKEHAEVSRVMNRVLHKYDKEASMLPRTIIHGDWHFWNQKYIRNEVSCVLDFDFVRNGTRLFDIAYSIWVIYLLLPNYASTFDASFLAGYGKLSDIEIYLLPAAVSRISLFFLCQSIHSAEPAVKWKHQYRKQMPFLEWMEKEGKSRIRSLASAVQA
ncbi:phosphotransferase enzyme family protein [Paenibacillus alvei]|uniref:phosphotransferase enzyme family protein n=1 Tax=Paenibacillus alvei TaxID=44250 RepID=UPI00157FCC13|nr:phosphotransferase [Paenibacillus alvei]